jgi:Peptidase family S41
MGQNFGKNQLIDDLNFLQQALQHGHPLNLVRPTPIDLSATIAELDLSLPDSISKATFENSVRKVLFQVGCVHTAVEGWGKSQTSPPRPTAFFPFNIFSNGQQIWVLGQTNDSLQTGVQKGDEILSINGHSAASILEVMQVYHPVDGQSDDFNLCFINKEFPALYYKCIDRSTSFVIRYRDHAGSDRSATLKATTVVHKVKPRAIPEAVIQGHQASFAVIGDSVGLLSLQGFHKNCKHFYKAVFAYIKGHALHNLIIDVRDNLGGSRNNAGELLSYLCTSKCQYETVRPKQNLAPFLKGGNKAKFAMSYMYYDMGKLFSRSRGADGVTFTSRIAPKKNRPMLRTFVLVNGFTASSASLLSAYLRHHAGAVIIGRQTGGGEFSNNGGSYPELVLPRSGLQIKTATYLMRYDMKGDEASGIVPDHVVQYDVDSYNTQDLELDLAWKLIRRP